MELFSFSHQNQELVFLSSPKSLISSWKSKRGEGEENGGRNGRYGVVSEWLWEWENNGEKRRKSKTDGLLRADFVHTVLV